MKILLQAQPIFLARYWPSLFGKKKMIVYQVSLVGGEVKVELTSDRVLLTGECVTTVEGTHFKSPETLNIQVGMNS